MQKIFYSVREAKDALNIGRSKLYQFILSGELESVKIGQRRLIRVESLTAFANSLASAA
ncbi:helix-turn-helix domain-containing protein [Sphingomonas sp. NSE70-1]|uniref:Helix-turn-helix domain-containing protein n=1 Tax=Sphingomonas caseinilyticus TaxID=2908205 RepID=A0ABT0RTE8_9SPHN|nr:helix-turn-helix domain-containing protein [Sphingomonas caseinilyticus]MCL6698292.1 helix-turn-helix domain-containing protein [Sphingomonas caseinilyticus]